MLTTLLFTTSSRRRWASLLSMLLVLLSLRTQAQTSGNPILPGSQADPEMDYFNGRYYIYPTTDVNSLGGQFHAFSSTDLTNWHDEGTIFNLGQQTNWADHGGWAPSMVGRNGKYYFYFTAHYNATNTPAIGVAVGNSPTGPFTYSDHPLLTPALSNNITQDVIDPMVFVDGDGQAYIYYGGSNGSRLVVRKLNSDMITLTSDAPRNITPPNYTEGPYLVKRNGTYYLSYSNGSWTNNTYNVQYSTSNSPTGPWTYGGSILSSDVQFGGPGHHSITQIPGCDDYYIVYHRYLTPTPNGSNGDQRHVAVDHLTFNYDGSIQKVNMTNYGVAPRPVNGTCPVSSNFSSGGFYKLTHKGTNQCLDAAGNNSTPGANVQQWTDNGNDAQRWLITLQGDGFYKLTHRGTNQCLDVNGNYSAPGTNVQQWTDNGNDAQRWSLQDMSDGFYKLIHKGTNQCLDVNGNYSTPGTNVQQWTDNGNDAQRWQFTLTEIPIWSGEVYRLTHKGTNQCLDADNNLSTPGTGIHQWTDNGNNAQRWIIISTGDGYYKLKHQGTNQCLDVDNNSSAAGAAVHQWTDNGNDAQRWSIIWYPDGYVKLVHKGTGLCLDVDNNLSNPGTGIHQWYDNGNDAQRWRLDLMPQSAIGARTMASTTTDAATAPLVIYPSPSAGQVHFVVKPAQTGAIALDVYDVQGRLMRHLADNAGISGQAAEYLLDGSTWAAGVYTVRLSTASQLTYGKLVLVH